MADRYILEQALRKEEELQRYYFAYCKRATARELQEFLDRSCREGAQRVNFIKEELRKIPRGG